MSVTNVDERMGFRMSVSFLNATKVLLDGLLNNVFSGSLMPGIDGVTGSLVKIIALS